jgi:hypothetical protein
MPVKKIGGPDSRTTGRKLFSTTSENDIFSLVVLLLRKPSVKMVFHRRFSYKNRHYKLAIFTGGFLKKPPLKIRFLMAVLLTPFLDKYLLTRIRG